MDEDSVFLTEYFIDGDLIDELFEEGTDIKEQDIDSDILKILRDNKIEYKVKLEEKWDDEFIIHKYSLVAKVYVNKIDYEKAMELLSSDQTIIDNVDELINAIDIKLDENGDYIEDDDEYDDEDKDDEDESNYDSANDDETENINHERNTGDSDDAIIERSNHIPGILSGVLLLALLAFTICYLFFL